MAHIPVQCQNCGARYKIPETFKSDAAKCKGCGTMIDVKSVRDAGAGADTGNNDAKPQAAPAKPTGGTRKPRKTATASSSKRRRAEVDDEPAKAASTRGTRRRGRRGADDDAGNHAGNDAGEGEEGGRGRYEKKKDNTPMIAAITIGGLGVVVAAIFMFANPFGDDETTETANKNDKTAVAKKADDGKKADEAAEPDPEADAKAAEADATKKADAKKARDAAAKKKADAAKKKALDAAAKKEITKPEQVFKPMSEFKKFDRPETVTEEEATTVNGLLDDLRAGSGLAAIQAPRKLNAFGWRILPLVTNRMLELDYSKAADSEYAYLLANRVVLTLGRWEFGYIQSRQADSFDLKDGHANALRMRNVHQLTRLYWTSPDAWDKYKAKFPKKFH
jgi:hypothetical protein